MASVIVVDDGAVEAIEDTLVVNRWKCCSIIWLAVLYDESSFNRLDAPTNESYSVSVKCFPYFPGWRL